MRELIAIALAACSAPVTPSVPSVTPVMPAAMWRPGVGVNGCALGATREACETAYGPGTIDPANPALVAFPAHGFEVFFDDATVRIHVWYRSRVVTTFRGTDPEGVGDGSTIAAVERAYGKGEPDPPYGPDREDVVAYPRKGVKLGFLDGALVHVMIERPWVSSATWLEHRSSIYKHRFPTGWTVIPLSIPPGGGLVEHALIISRPVQSFPAQAPVGEWIRIVVSKPRRSAGDPATCDAPRTVAMLGSEFRRCRSGTPPAPYDYTLTGEAGGHVYVLQHNGLDDDNAMITEILRTFELVGPATSP